jgi:hypothetical protein
MMEEARVQGANSKQKKKKEKDTLAPPSAKDVVAYLRDMVSFLAMQEAGDPSHTFPLISKKGKIIGEEEEEEGEEGQEMSEGKRNNKKIGDMLLLENMPYAHRRYELESRMQVQKKNGKRSFKGVKKRKTR